VPAPLPPHVALIANNPQTLDGLHHYLQGAGVEAHPSHGFAVPAATSAVIIFPDELDEAEVIAQVVSLRAARPAMVIVMVTGRPQRFKPALAPDDHSLLPIVLPKPAFGWTILDAIRRHPLKEAVS
jgi:hypothetical protein